MTDDYSKKDPVSIRRELNPDNKPDFTADTTDVERFMVQHGLALDDLAQYMFGFEGHTNYSIWALDSRLKAVEEYLGLSGELPEPEVPKEVLENGDNVLEFKTNKKANKNKPAS